MSAEGNALMIAHDDINLDVAHNYEAQTSASKASGWGFDNRLTGIPIGVYHKKANGDGATDTTVGTNLSVGGHATLATTSGDINIKDWLKLLLDDADGSYLEKCKSCGAGIIAQQKNAAFDTVH